MKFAFTSILVLFFSATFSQAIKYSEVIREDVRDINFEIIGRVGNNVQIYKNVRWKHMLAVYDQNMNLLSNARLTFMPDKTMNVDFMVYPGYSMAVYQYHRKNVIYCMGVKIDPAGKKIGEPVLLDTARVGLLMDRKIYGTVFSEDKENILVYRMMKKNNSLILRSLLFNKELQLQETAENILPFEDYRDVYSEMSVDNKGNMVFVHERKRSNREAVTGLDVYFKPKGENLVKMNKIPLSEMAIDEVSLKIDNMNGNYLLYSLYYDRPGGTISGVFTSRLDARSSPAIGAFIPFDDSLRKTLTSRAIGRSAFDNMFIREVVVRKDGGFIVNMEDFFSQSSANPWNRFNYLNSSAYPGSYDYYMYNPGYRYYYRPLPYNNFHAVRYYYNDIAILSIDRNLQPEWSTVIHKNQVSDESDNFLSYSRMNQGSEIVYFFIENERKNEMVTHHSIFPDGTVRRNGTLRGNQAGFEFMPRLAKQIGARQMIIPALYRGFVTFALVEI